jgi:hypothetical protein
MNHDFSKVQRKIVCKTLSQKNPSQKRVGGVAQVVGPEFKPQYCIKKKLLRGTSVWLKW